MTRIYLFNIVAWNYRKKIGFPVCKKENFAGLEGHRKGGKSARASPTPHHTLNEERSARFTAQPLFALVGTVRFPASFKASFQFMFERVIGIITKKTGSSHLSKATLRFSCIAMLLTVDLVVFTRHTKRSGKISIILRSINHICHYDNCSHSKASKKFVEMLYVHKSK